MNNTSSFASILDDNEKILWLGKPHFLPYLSTGFAFLMFGIIWGLIDLSFVGAFFSAKGTVKQVGFFLPFFLLHSAPCWLSILNMLRLFFSYANVAYALTDKRVLFRGGFWGINYKTIDYDKIEDIQVTINPLEKILGLGSISIDTGGRTSRGAVTYDKITGVSNPYDVFKVFKSTEINVKTDWEFPNKLRPTENPGYTTEYEPQNQ